MKTITTKFHGPTNTRGSRYSATDGDNRVSVSDDDTLNSGKNHDRACLALCKKLRWKGRMISGGTKTGYVYVFLPVEVMIAMRGRTCSDVLDFDFAGNPAESLCNPDRNIAPTEAL